MESINWVIDLQKVENLFDNVKSLDEFDDIIEKVKHDSGESKGKSNENIINLLIPLAKSYHLIGDVAVTKGQKGVLLQEIAKNNFRPNTTFGLENLVIILAEAHNQMNEGFNPLREEMPSLFFAML